MAPRIQPRRIDWYAGASIEEINAQLARVCADIDECLQTLFDDVETDIAALESSVVESVTDDSSGVVTVDNTDPQNPIVGFGGVNVDGVTVTGDGTSGDPLVAAATGWTKLFKASDTSRNDNTVTADPDLQFSMTANKKYVVRLSIFCTGETASDFRYQISGPAAPTDIEIFRYQVLPNTTTASFEVIEAYAGAPTSVACLTGQDGFIHIEATIQNGANAGTFSFDWAQNTTQAGEFAIVYAGSWMEYKLLN